MSIEHCPNSNKDTLVLWGLSYMYLVLVVSFHLSLTGMPPNPQRSLPQRRSAQLKTSNKNLVVFCQRNNLTIDSLQWAE